MAPKTKDKYHIRNWKQYNASLVNRGSITFWFSEDAIKKWHVVERTGKLGRTATYSDDAINDQSRFLNGAKSFTRIRQVAHFNSWT